MDSTIGMAYVGYQSGQGLCKEEGKEKNEKAHERGVG